MKLRRIFPLLAVGGGAAWWLSRDTKKTTPGAPIPGPGSPAVPSLGEILYTRALAAPDSVLDPNGKLVLGAMLAATGMPSEGAQLRQIAMGSIAAGVAATPTTPLDVSTIDATTDIVQELRDVGLDDEADLLRAFIRAAMAEVEAQNAA